VGVRGGWGLVELKFGSATMQFFTNKISDRQNLVSYKFNIIDMSYGMCEIKKRPKAHVY
jgi:hypothetical protein